jgi:hypothetical protein
MWSAKVEERERRELRIVGGTICRARGESMRVISWVSAYGVGSHLVHCEVGVLDPGGEGGEVENSLDWGS